MEPTKTVSILKEKWDGDVRVILVPDAIPLFTQSGFRVLVESGAGAGLGYADCAYADQGAKIVDTEAAWTESSYVVKYKAPHPSEYCYFRAGLTLGAFVYLEHDPALARRFCDTGMTLYGLTYFRSPSGNFPMIVSCNELSGKMAVLYGAYHLQNNHGGRGMLLSRIPGAEQPNVLVIGYGNVGGAAARLANDMGCSVTCLGTDPERLRKFEGTMPHTVRCLINTPDVLRHELSQADLVIGAIQISTYDTPPMIDRGMLKLMKPGAVIVDVTCGYGPGYLPTFHSFTTHDAPYYVVDGIVHIKIDRIPMSVPITESQGTSRVVAPHLVALGRAIYEEGFTDPTSQAGRLIESGRIVRSDVARNLEMMENHEAHAQAG